MHHSRIQGSRFLPFSEQHAYSHLALLPQTRSRWLPNASLDATVTSLPMLYLRRPAAGTALNRGPYFQYYGHEAASIGNTCAMSQTSSGYLGIKLSRFATSIRSRLLSCVGCNKADMFDFAKTFSRKPNLALRKLGRVSWHGLFPYCCLIVKSVLSRAP